MIEKPSSESSPPTSEGHLVLLSVECEVRGVDFHLSTKSSE